MQNSEKPIGISLSSESDPAGSCQFVQNNEGTCASGDTPVTQGCSEPVHPGWVYFIQADGAIKIGHSHDPEQRLKELQTGSPRELFLVAKRKGPPRLEKAYHRRFAGLKIRREWFRAEKHLLNLIGQYRIRLPRKSVVAPQPVAKEIKMPSEPPLSAEAQAKHRKLDCHARRAPNKTDRMKLELRMAMIRDGATANFTARQDALLGGKPRIRVQAITSEHRP